ncbi:MAG TPA: biopolymer transporter ExbD [Nitrospiria bacterium]|nr:biopolymer transporter ExbD [Nitrospiria bacterium]
MEFGSMDQDGSPHPLSEINMIPLIDVMLVLLVVFIVTAPLLTRSVKVNLPKADTKTSSVKSAVVISLNRDLELFLDDAPISREELERTLRLRVERGESPTVELHADGEIAYRNIVSLMALLQNAGVTKLSFITEPDNKGANHSG